MAGSSQGQAPYDRPIFGAAQGPARVRRRRRLSLQARMLLFAVVILAVIVSAAVWALRPRATRYVLDNYQVITVGTYDFRNLVLTAGRVQPRQIAVFKAPSLGQNAARIEVVHVYVQPGDDVTAGQILVELASDHLEEELRRLEGDLAAARIELEQARLQAEQENAQKQRELDQAVREHEAAEEHLALVTELYARGGVARKEYEDAVRAVAERAAQIQAAEHALTLTRQRGDLNIRKAENHVTALEKELAALRAQAQALVVRADRNGRVLSVQVVPGTAVAPGAELLSLADLSQQYVEAAVTPEQALSLRPDLPAVLRFGGIAVPATVEHVAPTAVSTSEGSAVRVTLALDPEVAQRLLPNTEVSVEIETGIRPDRPAVLRGPFFATGDTSFVYVVSPDGTEAYRRDVRFGVVDGGVIEVLEGLAPGERIIYSSYSAFRSYPTVTLLPEGGREVAWP